MMFLDLAGYLPDNNLVKVDRASMSVGLEMRSPLLDHRVVELAFRLPLAMRLGQDRGKLVLWRLLERHVPRALFERPKQGFGVPVGPWLRGPLRDWAEGLLDERRLREDGLLEPATVEAVWAQHLAKGRDDRQLLWHLLMFQAWREYWRADAMRWHPRRSRSVRRHDRPASDCVAEAQASVQAQRRVKKHVRPGCRRGLTPDQSVAVGELAT